MVFDFFGNRRKVVIAMAHLGALPGTPLYDAAGGMNKLIDGVARRYREASSRRRPCHHVRQRERSALPIQGAGRVHRRDDRRDRRDQAGAQGSVRRQLSLGPRRQPWPSPVPPAPRSRAKSLPGSFRFGHGAVAARRRDCSVACGANLGRPDLRLLFNINAEFAVFPRYETDRIAGQECGILVPWLTPSWCPDRSPGRRGNLRPTQGPRRGPRCAEFSPIPACASTM